jgi:hypothetical protein
MHAIVGGAGCGYDGGRKQVALQLGIEGNAMKNPLDSLGQTITLGVVLTIVVILLIHAIA